MLSGKVRLAMLTCHPSPSESATRSARVRSKLALNAAAERMLDAALKECAPSDPAMLPKYTCKDEDGAR
jgi:hypothetical protein